jgi:hypothetical protein
MCTFHISSLASGEADLVESRSVARRHHPPMEACALCTL